MEHKKVFVMEIWCHPLDNGIVHHEVHLFGSYHQAMDFINREAAYDYGLPIPKGFSAHVGYGYKEIDGVKKRPQWNVNGHWREGGIWLFPSPISDKIRKGSIEKVEIYPADVE